MQQASTIQAQNQNQTASWLKIGSFIDLKDKQGQWRVALILNVTKTQIRVRYDGWPSKYDENFLISSSSIRPFRSVIRGYTGQVESAGPREHYKFSEAYHKQNFEAKLNQFIQKMNTKSELEINQFIRGSHYAWIDFLMSLTYNHNSQIVLVYQYFFKHLELVMLYFRSMLQQKSIDGWFKAEGGQKSEQMIKIQRAFADSYYEIFDSVFSIMDCYPRLKVFFKSNQALISNFISGHTTHLEFMSEYLNQIGLHQILEDVIQRLQTDKTSIVSLSFITAFTRLFSSIQKTIKDKQKKKQLTQRLCQVILRHCSQMPQISIKQEQNELQKIYSTCKMMLLKYNWKTQFLLQFQMINLLSWKCMIMSEKLQRKVKAINKLKTYYSNVVNTQKKQSYMIFNTKQTIDKEIRNQQILQAIFIGNQHHQIIKKGCQLVIDLYKYESITSEELSIIWKSCRHRLQAVRKVMYSFFEQICKDLRHNDLMVLAQWVVSQHLAQQIDKSFFYNLFKQVIQSANIPAMQFFFEFSEKRLLQNKQQVKQFSQLLSTQKSFKAGFLQLYSNKIIKLVPVQKTSQDTLFYLNFANQIYYDARNKQLNLDNQCYNLILSALCQILKSKVKIQDTVEYEKKKQKVSQFLKLIQNLNDQFYVEPKQFMNLWQLFSQSYNQQFRQNVFLPWILQVKHRGTLQFQCLTLNQCLKQKVLKKELFNSIFKKHTHIDYINLSQIQFKIFKKFLLQVNKDEGTINQINNGWTGLIYFRVSETAESIDGLKELNDIFLNCRNQAVVRKAATLLKELHLNYPTSKLPHNSDLRIKKAEELLSRAQRYITDGVKKSNLRLIKNALYLLLDIALTVKQAYPITQRQIVQPTYHGKNFKKTYKIIKDQKQLFQIQVQTTNSVRSLKKMICDQSNIPMYNLKIYKSFYQLKKIDDDGQSVSSASASSQSSYPSGAKKDRNYTIIKNKVQQQIPNQYLYYPIWAIASQFDDSIIIVETPNTIYTLIQKFVTQKVSQQLLKILTDTSYYSKQISQLAYSILIQISSSNTSAYQILINLINQLKAKCKNAQSIGLSQQSVNFKMYFCKNMNRLSNQDLISLTEQINIGICADVLKQLTRQITQSLQIDLLIQVLAFVKRGISISKVLATTFNPSTIFLCLLNLLQFINGLKKAQQFKKQQRSHYYLSQTKVFTQCLNLIEIIYDKNSQKIIDAIVQNQHFLRIITLLYTNINKRQFGQIFANRFDRILKSVSKLNDNTQQILYQVIFNQVYYRVIVSNLKRNPGFFKIIQDVISVSSNQVIKRLFVGQQQRNGISFWQNCLKIVDQQSDFHDQNQKQNKFLSGHLHIISSLIRKNPSALSQHICQSILYNCLCYNQKYTIGEQVKCISKSSIHAALAVLLTICQTGEKYMLSVVKQLRKYQLTKYWRTPDFWNVNLQLEAKSTTGFVGLQNPGCICYLNSFTQMLFMNIQFRNQVVNFQALDENKDYSLLSQLRKIFLNLEHSNQRYLNPVPFTSTIKNAENKPMIKIFQQMDIQQYSSILFDKIQKLLPKDQDFVKQIFGGTYSNDIISKQCKHCSQRQESFISMQLDVKSNLQESLKTLVKGQLLEGQNAYFCDKCNKKVKALKRMSIKKLPNNLIICLKRFEYNFETDQKFKINASCEFPKQMTLQPYSQQTLNSDQELNEPVKIQQAETQQKLSHEYFQYRLKGVIIHKGSSQSGHYYALIEASPGSQKWIQFNDSQVTQFDLQNLPEEAYGSDDPTNPKLKNAYMLVYERKKKLKNDQKMTQTNLALSNQKSEVYSQQAIQLLKQIRIRNKQIRTFNMMFSFQYRTFISQILLHTLRINIQLWNQYTKQFKIQSSSAQNQIPGPLSKINQYSYETIHQALKCYLQYCLFVKARQTSIQQFLQNLKQLDILMKLEIAQPVVYYFLHELSQPLLIQELFVEISFRNKLLIISYFIYSLISGLLKNKSNQISQLILKLVETMMIVTVQNNMCVNQIMYIIRSIADQSLEYLSYFQQIPIFQITYSILAGVRQSESEKLSLIDSIKLGIYDILRRQEIQKNKGMIQETDQSNKLVNKKYEIYTVNKTNRIFLKIQSPQQAWNLLYLIYQSQSKAINKQFNQTGQLDKQTNILLAKRQQFQKQFVKLKDPRISHFIEQTQGSRCSASLSLFLCQLSHQNQQITDKLIGIIKNRVKALQAIKFKPYLILMYYMIMHRDSLMRRRIINFLEVLQYCLAQNSKYFSQSDILHQWIMKLVLNSSQFAQSLVRTDPGVELLNQVMEKLQSHKRPTAQFMKKQKNSSYERYNYQIHGLMISYDYDDYEKLYETKRDFFMTLFHEKPLSNQLINQTYMLAIPEPSYRDLVHKPKSNQIMFYLFSSKWSKVLVKFCKFGILKISKIVKQKQNTSTRQSAKQVQGGWKKKQPEVLQKNLHQSKEGQINIGQGYVLEQQHSICEFEDRLRVLPQQSHMLMAGYNPHKIAQTQNNMEIQQSNSDLSYQSYSGNL